MAFSRFMNNNFSRTEDLRKKVFGSKQSNEQEGGTGITLPKAHFNVRNEIPKCLLDRMKRSLIETKYKKVRIF